MFCHVLIIILYNYYNKTKRPVCQSQHFKDKSYLALHEDYYNNFLKGIY